MFWLGLGLGLGLGHGFGLGHGLGLGHIFCLGRLIWTDLDVTIFFSIPKKERTQGEGRAYHFFAIWDFLEFLVEG